jgi:hypothetical protein
MHEALDHIAANGRRADGTELLVAGNVVPPGGGGPGAVVHRLWRCHLPARSGECGVRLWR